MYVLIIAFEISRVVLALNSAAEWAMVELVDRMWLGFIQRVCSLAAFRLATAAGVACLDRVASSVPIE